ncbi:MAG: tyrosine--tRNA ligase [Saprospiraceae bacterium]
MKFIEELAWRGMLQDKTPGIEDLLAKERVTAYIGFDPTAPSLTIGNYVQIMILKFFQMSGHQPLVLMGGATGRIGDPSGKDKERVLKTNEELDRNLHRQMEQFKNLLDFENGDNRALMVNNFDFYKDMNVLDFLRNVGKTLTVNYMMSKDSVQNRLETGLSFTEFSYQILQAYDYQVLFNEYGCKLQMGGSDQWGNITSGTEFIRRNLGEKAYAVTTPLLTKSDGKKFGKSEQGNIWLDPEMTSPYKFYQFWINADDADLPKFIRYFSLKSREEIETTEKDLANDPRELKEWLAEELTVRIHGQEAYDGVKKVSEILFNKKADAVMLQGLSEKELEFVLAEIPSFQLNKEILDAPLGIIEILTQQTQIFNSSGEARRSIQGNALTINKVKIADHSMQLTKDDLLKGKYLMVENGKKNKYLISFS